MFTPEPLYPDFKRPASILKHRAAHHQPSGSRQFARRVLVIWATCLILAGSLSQAQQLVQNGGFETGNFAGWTQSGNTNYTDVSIAAAYTHSGTYGAQLGPVSSRGYLSQTLATIPGQSYLLSLWLDSPDGQT